MPWPTRRTTTRYQIAVNAFEDQRPHGGEAVASVGIPPSCAEGPHAATIQQAKGATAEGAQSRSKVAT